MPECVIKIQLETKTLFVVVDLAHTCVCSQCMRGSTRISEPPHLAEIQSSSIYVAVLTSLSETGGASLACQPFAGRAASSDHAVRTRRVAPIPTARTAPLTRQQIQIRIVVEKMCSRKQQQFEEAARI